VETRLGVEAHDLAPRVHAGIGTAGARQSPRRVAQETLERPGEHSFDGADLGLLGPPVEPAAVVRDDELHSGRTFVPFKQSHERAPPAGAGVSPAPENEPCWLERKRQLARPES